MATENGELCERGMMFARKIVGERAHQTARFSPDGTEEALDRVDDHQNDELMFSAYIGHHAMRWFPGGFGPWDQRTVETFMRQMIKVAALAYAAHEWADRKLRKMRQEGEA